MSTGRSLYASTTAEMSLTSTESTFELAQGLGNAFIKHAMDGGMAANGDIVRSANIVSLEVVRRCTTCKEDDVPDSSCPKCARIDQTTFERMCPVCKRTWPQNDPSCADCAANRKD